MSPLSKPSRIRAKIREGNKRLQHYVQAMTIKNNRGETMITLEGFWSVMLKVALALLVPVTGAAFSFCWWVTTTIQSHSSELRDINTRMAFIGVATRDNSNQLKENAGHNQ